MLTSCEQVVDVATLPHEEKIFVEGILSSDQDIEIIFSKTLPPLDTTFSNNGQIDTLITRITDLKGTIRVDGIAYPLQHVGFGRYRIVDGLDQPIKGKMGSSYELQATWKDLNIHANTKIPMYPTTTVIRSSIDTQNRVLFWGREYLKATFETESIVKPNETWLLSISTENTFTLEVREFFEREIGTREDSVFYFYGGGFKKYLPANNKPHRSEFIVYLYVDPGQSIADVLSSYASSKLIIRTFDKAWKSYIDTQYLGEGFDGIFGGSESGIQWNIKGDGLGLFIGKNEAQIPLRL